jgi:hypothetical protein
VITQPRPRLDRVGEWDSAARLVGLPARATRTAGATAPITRLGSRVIARAASATEQDRDEHSRQHEDELCQSNQIHAAHLTLPRHEPTVPRGQNRLANGAKSGGSPVPQGV